MASVRCSKISKKMIFKNLIPEEIFQEERFNGKRREIIEVTNSEFPKPIKFKEEKRIIEESKINKSKVRRQVFKREKKEERRIEFINSALEIGRVSF